ncbi:MAG: zinc ABC transporter substrate-binding protein [Sneathiella sp.]|jgi:zinc transport system substrate-binding protein|nr:zinc ABC transporter substrate-binding protein [Sneathiella sp.]
MRLIYFVICLVFIATSAQATETKGIVVTIKPLHSLVAGVIGETGEATLLVDGAASVHGFSLKPSQVKSLQTARAVFYIDGRLESFLKNALDSLPPNIRKIALSEAEGLKLLERREGGAWDAHDHDNHSTHAHEHAHDDEEHNLHIWLDPENARRMTIAIAATLGAVYPENQTIYAENAERQLQRLKALDQALADRFAAVRDLPFVVLHDAYPYLETRYRLNAVGSLTLEPDAPTSAKKLGDIRDRLRQSGARCIFREPQFNDRLLLTAAEDLPVKIGILDPLGADLAPGSELYFQLMTTLANNLTDCLQS